MSGETCNAMLPYRVLQGLSLSEVNFNNWESWVNVQEDCNFNNGQVRRCSHEARGQPRPRKRRGPVSECETGRMSGDEVGAKAYVAASPDLDHPQPFCVGWQITTLHQQRGRAGYLRQQIRKGK